MASEKPDWLTDLKVLDVRRGDLVVVRCKTFISEKEIEQLRECLGPILPEGVKVAIFEEDMEIGVIRPHENGENDE